MSKFHDAIMSYTDPNIDMLGSKPFCSIAFEYDKVLCRKQEAMVSQGTCGNACANQRAVVLPPSPCMSVLAY